MDKGLLHSHNFVLSIKRLACGKFRKECAGLKTLSIRIAASKVRHPSPLVIPTGAYPDFLLRAASDDHACGSP
jgi:hypothetical protein